MYLTDRLLTHINLLFYLHSKARVFPLRIASITENMCLPAEAQDELPLSLVETVMGSLRHVSTRLTAHRIASSLEKLQPREAALKTRVVQKRIDRATSAPNLRDKMKAQRARAASPSLLSTKTRLPQAQSRLAFPRSPVTESPRNRSDVSLLNDTVMTENRSNAGSEQAHPANSALPAPSYIATQLLTFPPASRSRRGSSTSISQDDSAHSQASTQLSSHLGEETEGTSRGEATQKEMEELEELRSMNPEEDPMECSTLPKSMPQSLPDAPPSLPDTTPAPIEIEKPAASSPPLEIASPQQPQPEERKPKVVNRPRSESATLLLTRAGKRSPIQLQMHQISLGPAANAPVGSEHLSLTPHRLPTSFKESQKRKSSKAPEAVPELSLSRSVSRSSQNLRKKLLSSPNLKSALKMRRGSQQENIEGIQRKQSSLGQNDLRMDSNEPSLGSVSTLLSPLQRKATLNEVPESIEASTSPNELSSKRSTPKLLKSRSSRFLRRMLSMGGSKDEEVPPLPSSPRSYSMVSSISNYGDQRSVLGLDLGGVDLRPLPNQVQESPIQSRSVSMSSNNTSSGDQATVRRRRDRSSSKSLSLSSIKSFDALRKLSLRSSKRPCVEGQSMVASPSPSPPSKVN